MTAASMKKIPVQTILLSGLLVGTLDILAAFVDYYIATGKDPVTIPGIILKYIASGLFGKEAFAGGAIYIWLGLLLHYIIAFVFTFLFFWLYSRISLLSKSWVLTGVVYGLFIWCIMNLIVVPSSSAPHKPLSAMEFTKALKSALILIVMIGLPLAFIAGRAKGKKE